MQENMGIEAFSDEVWFVILIRLPIKDVLVCESVCKTWKCICESSSFHERKWRKECEKNNWLVSSTNEKTWKQKYMEAFHSVSKVKQICIKIKQGLGIVDEV